MRIAICNNRKESLTLSSMLYASEPLKGIDYAVTVFENKEALIGAFRDNPKCFDIVLLNPALGGTGSPKAAHHIRMVNLDCPIILTAQNNDLALEGYSVYATGYLVHPFSQAQLDFFLRRAISLCGRSQSVGLFYVKNNQEYVAVSEANLVFVESVLKYLLLHLLDGTVVRTLMPLKKFYDELHGGQFLLSNKSFIVNMDYITRIAPYEFTLGSYGTAAITQRNYPQIRNTYFAYSSRRADELSGICEY